MVKVLVKHSSHVFSELQKNGIDTKANDTMEQFPDQLPCKFSAQDFKALAKSMAINDRSAVRYIAVFCEKGLVCRNDRGSYTNLTSIETENDRIKLESGRFPSKRKRDMGENENT